MENKEEILANFQSITAIDDIGEAFSHLEETNWDLMAAIARVIPQDDSEIIDQFQVIAPTQSAASSSSSNQVAGASNAATEPLNDLSSTQNNVASTSNNRIWNNSVSAFAQIPTASDDAQIANLASDIALDSNGRHINNIDNNNSTQIKFVIYFKNSSHIIWMPATATVEKLKKKILDVTYVPVCRQAIRGWPPSKASEANRPDTRLSDLQLSSEAELILVDMTEEGFMDCEADDTSQRLGRTYTLTIAEQPSGRQITLNFQGNTTIEKVKTDVYYITDIEVRHQEWTGWPVGCTNSTTLADSGIECTHNFTVQSSDASSSGINNSNEAYIPEDSESSVDDFEDANDFNTSDDLFTETLTTQPISRHLISNNANNETDATAEFIDNYKRRFGEPHPEFYNGSLQDAHDEACQKPARERKLLAIYLHHGDSILTNVFCDHLMKHESIIQTLHENFVLFGWDLSFETNKHMLLSLITACISNTASLTVRNITVDQLPALVIVGRSRLSGSSSSEVLSVIHGNISLDDLMMRLLESVEVYNQHLQVEITMDDQRTARELVKAEQDQAYEATLRIDMAKEEAKRQREAEIAAECKRRDSERAEENARRESIRLVAEQSMPEEPDASDENVTKIRVRLPTGAFLDRRFYRDNTLQDLLNFVAANGYIIDEYKLITSYPRRDLSAVDANQTLQALNLYPQEMVILEGRF